MNHSSSVRKVKDNQVAFFRNVADQYPEVFYIPGNHEHYHGHYDNTVPILQEELSQFPNIKVGDKIIHEDADFVLVGATMWTDFSKGSPNDFLYANIGMNDFHLVKKGSSGSDRFQAQDAFVEHQIAKDFLETAANTYSNKKLIIVTHHLPSWEAISPGFRDSRLNGAYAANMDDYIEKYKPYAWIHGHSHPHCSMVIGETKVLRKPRGYVGYENTPEEDAKYTYGILEV